MVDYFYKIGRIFSKTNNRYLELLIWHILRRLLNLIIPNYYRKDKSGKSDQIDLATFTDKELIVSLTSFPARIAILPLVLESLLHQTVKPSAIILWLASEQFPDKEALFYSFDKYIKKGVQVLFCDDLKAHKKYYYSMMNNPDSIIVTVDDDIIYPESLIEDLLITHKKYPQCIVATRGHLMTFSNGMPQPYCNWKYRSRGYAGPDLRIMATGSGGVLYPPHLLSDHVFDKKVLLDKCFFADDIWLKCMEYLNDVPVVLTRSDNPEMFTVLGTEASALALTNIQKGENDKQLREVSEYYGIIWPY